MMIVTLLFGFGIIIFFCALMIIHLDDQVKKLSEELRLLKQRLKRGGMQQIDPT